MEEKKAKTTKAEEAKAVQADAEALQEEALDKVAGGKALVELKRVYVGTDKDGVPIYVEIPVPTGLTK